MTTEPPVGPHARPGRAEALARFRWENGHADVWRIFTDGTALRAVVDGMADPWRDAGSTHVVGIESRGFLLGAAVAVELAVGFVAIRKGGTGLLAGPKVTARAKPDYRGTSHELRMQMVLRAGDRVLLVDDWAERGSQAAAARALVESCGATWLGASVIVDQLSDDSRARVGPVTSLVTADELAAGPGQNVQR